MNRITGNENTIYCPHPPCTHSNGSDPFSLLNLKFIAGTNVKIDFSFIDTDILQESLTRLLLRLKTWSSNYFTVINSQHEKLLKQKNIEEFSDRDLKYLDRAIVQTKRARSAITLWSVRIQTFVSEIFDLIERYVDSRQKVAILKDRMEYAINDQFDPVATMKRSRSFARTARNERRKLLVYLII